MGRELELVGILGGGPIGGEVLGGKEPGLDQRFTLELVRFVSVGLDLSKLNEFSFEPYVDTDCIEAGRR